MSQRKLTLWKFTCQKREISHVDTGTFILPSIWFFVHTSFAGKVIPSMEGDILRIYKKIILSWILELSFLTDSYGKFPHSRGKNVLEEERKKERLPCLSSLFFLEYISGKFRKCWKSLIQSTEPVFLNVYGAQESIPRNEFRQPM